MALWTSAVRQRVPDGLRPVPELAGGLPAVGHAVDFIRGPVDLMFRAHRDLGEIAAFKVLNRRMIAAFGPTAHEAVFRAPETTLSRSEAYKLMTPVFGKDVAYDAPPEKLAQQLRMLIPALQPERMRSYGTAVVRETERSVSAWGSAGVIELVDFCRLLTNLASSRCLLGDEFRDGMSDEFARVYQALERGIKPIAYINPRLPIPSFIRRDRARARLVELITEVVDRRRRRDQSGEDFLQTLMESTYSDGRALSGHEITGLVLAAMFAGHHTSAVTIAWTVIELLRHREHLARVVAEIDHVLGGDADVSHASLRDLRATQHAVKETLRLHPPLALLVRAVKHDWSYKHWFVPKDTWIVVSPTVSHRLGEHFRDPDTFDPDRFARPGEHEQGPYTFIAFGGGRHPCLGSAFAVLQITAILAVLLHRYDLELTGDAIEPNFAGLVVGPKQPVRVRYRLRPVPQPRRALGP